MGWLRLCKQPVPGDPVTNHGEERPYRAFNAQLTRPTLPLRIGHAASAALPPWPNGERIDADPATFVPVLQRGYGGTPDSPGLQPRYTAITPSDLFPLVEMPKSYNRGGR